MCGVGNSLSIAKGCDHPTAPRKLGAKWHEALFVRVPLSGEFRRQVTALAGGGGPGMKEGEGQVSVFLISGKIIYVPVGGYYLLSSLSRIFHKRNSPHGARTSAVAPQSVVHIHNLLCQECGKGNAV